MSFTPTNEAVQAAQIAEFRDKPMQEVLAAAYVVDEPKIRADEWAKNVLHMEQREQALTDAESKIRADERKKVINELRSIPTGEVVDLMISTFMGDAAKILADRLTNRPS